MAHDVAVCSSFVEIKVEGSVRVLRLTSPDGMNRLSRVCIAELLGAFHKLKDEPTAPPTVIAGNRKAFSVGADLNEIERLNGAEGYEFSAMGRALMNTVSAHEALVIAAIEGYCMGGGLDLALACHRRIGAPNAVFGHRGATLGLLTGWGGTQRLPRLVGRSRALELFFTADKISAARALEIGLIDAIAQDPLAAALRCATAGIVNS
jgi:enoyl-CoA hydratase